MRADNKKDGNVYHLDFKRKKPGDPHKGKRYSRRKPPRRSLFQGLYGRFDPRDRTATAFLIFGIIVLLISLARSLK